MKKLSIYIAFLLVVLFSACNNSDDSIKRDLNIGFPKSKIDVGENSGMLDIPVVLSGARKEMALDVEVTVQSKNGTAIEGVDYKLKSNKLKMNRVGEYSISIEIIDNKALEVENKTFSVAISNVASGYLVVKNIAEVMVYIINDDTPMFDYAGSYTLTGLDYFNGTPYSSPAGGVTIVQDKNNPKIYYFENLAFINGSKVLPFTRSTTERLSFTMGNKVGSMPMEQNIGDYGSGNGMLISISAAGNISTEPIPINRVEKQLLFDTAGIAGVFIKKDGKASIYYAYKNIILTKTN